MAFFKRIGEGYKKAKAGYERYETEAEQRRSTGIKTDIARYREQNKLQMEKTKLAKEKAKLQQLRGQTQPYQNPLYTSPFNEPKKVVAKVKRRKKRKTKRRKKRR